MTDLQSEITKLIGSKELSFGCYVWVKDKDYEWKPLARVVIKKIVWTTSWSGYDAVDDCISVYIDFWWMFYGWKFKPMVSFSKNKMEIIGHPATLSDLHRFLENENTFHRFEQNICSIRMIRMDDCFNVIPYDASKDLLDQSEETLKQIIDFIKANK